MNFFQGHEEPKQSKMISQFKNYSRIDCGVPPWICAVLGHVGMQFDNKIIWRHNGFSQWNDTWWHKPLDNFELWRPEKSWQHNVVCGRNDMMRNGRIDSFQGRIYLQADRNLSRGGAFWNFPGLSICIYVIVYFIFQDTDIHPCRKKEGNLDILYRKIILWRRNESKH